MMVQKPKDEILIERIRPILSRRRGFSEKKMFDGVCFMINGNMCVGTRKGFLVVRLDNARHDSIQSEPWTKEFDITGKVMKGRTLITPRGIKDDEGVVTGILKLSVAILGAQKQNPEQRGIDRRKMFQAGICLPGKAGCSRNGRESCVRSLRHC